MNELKVKASQEQLHNVLSFIEKELLEEAPDKKVLAKIQLASEEIFINIAHYAYKGETGEAIIRIYVVDEYVAVEFEDSGIPFNPLEKVEPDITAAIDKRNIGGLGIYITKRMMDRVEYRYESGKNILLIKVYKR